MRVPAQASRDFRAKAISGTHTVLMALDCPEHRRKGLMGFAFEREIVEPRYAPPKWLRSQKVFKSIIPNPKEARDPNDPSKPRRFYTNEFPIQSFIWSDYAASPDTLYRFRILPMYGKPGALATDPKDEIKFEIRTEKDFDQGHGVWFNRGAIASQKFAEEFENTAPTNINDPKDRKVAWLSRGLLEACLNYIKATPPGDGLRVAAYEFTYAPVLEALKERLDSGVDVRILYHDTSHSADRPNEAALESAGLPVNDQKITFRRSNTKIPHNKFIVRLKGATEPVEVWTGSTNFTPSGFLGQTNVGHLIGHPGTAKKFLAYWELFKQDPVQDKARASAEKLTPDPPALIGEKSVVELFSPRTKSDLLKWYADRVDDAAGSVMFTAAFGVAKQLAPSLAKDRNYLRFLLLEKPLTVALKTQFDKERDLIISYGVPLGEIYTFKNGKPTARVRVKEFELDKWFFKEEHFRKKNEGFVFFVHTKFLLIDPLSDDPLVCSGSANFSSNSLLQNDENMLLIRGDTRVADIYMTEFDRIFRHFYFRNLANEIEARGDQAEGAFLSKNSSWTDSYFRPAAFKTRRREMFFATPTPTWAENAAARGAAPASKRTTKGAAKKKTPAKKTPARKPARVKTAAKKALAKKPAKRTKPATKKG